MSGEGLNVIITGGASGIGLATAARLAGRGARVACLDLRPEVPEPLLGVEADVTDDASVRAAVETAAEKLGGIDVLVNNAGIGAAGTVEDNTDDEWRKVFEVNVFGIVRTTRAALPHLRRSARPAIVNTCSVAAVVGLSDRAVYSASKGAVLALTRAMATDLLADAIRVTCVNPGSAELVAPLTRGPSPSVVAGSPLVPRSRARSSVSPTAARSLRSCVDTPWVDRLLAAAPDPTAERAALAARQPTGRLVTADEVAAAIAYLASPESSAVTGTALAVDGGMHDLRPRPRT